MPNVFLWLLRITLRLSTVLVLRSYTYQGTCKCCWTVEPSNETFLIHFRNNWKLTYCVCQSFSLAFLICTRLNRFHFRIQLKNIRFYICMRSIHVHFRTHMCDFRFYAPGFENRRKLRRRCTMCDSFKRKM